MQKVRVLKNKYYLLPSGNLARVIRADEKKNLVIIFNYGLNKNELLEYDTAKIVLSPVFKISEAARMLGRSPVTLRYYEAKGLVAPARQFRVGAKNVMRMYTKGDIDDIAEMITERAYRSSPNRGNMGGPASRRSIESTYSKRLEK
jgi:hypothetical protein